MEGVMTGEVAKATARRWILGIWDGGQLNLLDELASSSYSYTAPGCSDLRGQAFKEYVNQARVAFPDLQNTIEEQIAEGNKVVTKGTSRATHQGMFAGIAPTGRALVMPWVIITEFDGDKIARDWEVFDALAFMQQLGALPAAT
jgi:predicted ester cyclase